MSTQKRDLPPLPRPLYREAREVQRPAGPIHVGLWYDKFADAWRGSGWSEPEFDKQPWIASMVNGARQAVDGAALAETIERQAAMAEKLGGVDIRLRNTSRFMTGLGRAHPVENGFAWHHTLGTPYLPGSGLKGVLLSWLRMNGDEGRQGWFGSPGAVGEIVFLDVLPVAAPVLCTEIMTPHYGRYYQEAGNPPAPGDWFDPTPIPFLAVEAGQSWQCALLPRPGSPPWDDRMRDELRRHLEDALSWVGAGAKTAVGYGRFEAAADEAQPRVPPGTVSPSQPLGGGARVVRQAEQAAPGPVTQTQLETVELIEDGKKGTGRVRTERGEEIPCTGIPAYKLGKHFLAVVTREAHAAVSARFKAWS